MTLTYRAAGAWGAGKGSNLSAAEADGNIYHLKLLIDDLTENIPQGVSVVDFIVTGTQFSVVLSDASTLGPYALPVAAFHWSFEWTPDTAYSELDTFHVDGFGIYLVLQDYTSGPTFDPDVSTTAGPVLTQMLPETPPTQLTIRNIATSGPLTTADAGGYVRANFASPGTVSIATEADAGWEIGTVISIRRVDDEVVIMADTDVTLYTPETLTLRKAGSTATALYIGDDAWDIAGDLELAP